MHKRLLVLYLFVFSIFQAGNAQIDLQQMKKDAMAIKNKPGAGKKSRKDQLPAGMDNSWKVSITLTRIMESNVSMTETAGRRDFDVAVAHEMAHGCGVWHHGKLNSLDPPDKNTLDDTSYQFLTINNLHADKESIAGFKKTGLLDPISGPGGQSSGDMRCIMCYEGSYVWAEPSGTNGRVFISVDHQDEYPKTLFCNSKTGTILNAPGRKLYPVYGDAGRGDCIHQFQLKDW